MRGIIVHMGRVDSGHYYSFIKDTSGTWFEFNDKVVKKTTLEEVKEKSFGQEYELNVSVGAYVLFYERKEKFDP